MEDFFKQIKNNLENRPEPPFNEQLWRSLENNLDEQEKDKRKPAAAGFAWWWIALPLLFVLLGSNTLFFMELKKANAKISTLEERRDTIFQTKVVYRIDTIYQTLVVRKPARTTSRPVTPMMPALTNPAPTSGLLPTWTNQFFEKTETKASAQPSVFLQKNPAEAFQNQDFTPPVHALEFPDLTPFKSNRQIPVSDSKPVLAEKRKTLRHRLYAMRPKAFQLGMAGGLSYPLSDGIERQTGFSVGLEAAVEFSPNLVMWLDASYFNVEFESNRMDESIGVPVVDPSGEFHFVKAEVPQPSLQYSAGLQYLFNAGGKWKPFIGLGFGAVSTLPYDVLYEFEDQASGVEWIFEQGIERRELMGGFVVFRSGFEYEISKKCHLLLRANYRTRWNENGFQVAKMLGIQSGVKFHF